MSEGLEAAGAFQDEGFTTGLETEAGASGASAGAGAARPTLTAVDDWTTARSDTANDGGAFATMADD